VGDSAEVICEHKQKKKLHLFDTFAGHPDTIGRYDVGQHVGRHSADIKDVKKRLKKYHRVYFYKGIFPETSKPVIKKKFCFVNLDTDLYRGTYDGLEFFIPRMIKGGIITIHDYQGIPGVACAVIDYFEDNHKGEKFEILLEDNQAIIYG
jgi:O-methyltransferase